MILGLVGRAGSGKTTIADYLVFRYEFKKYSFADPLKQMLLKAGMCSHEELYGEKTANSRWLMQKVGTEIFRKQIDSEYWIKKAHKKIFNCENENVVIDDVRFPEEAEWIMTGCKSAGFIIKIVRKNYIDTHAGFGHDSERFLNKIIPDFLIKAKSGDTDFLIRQADEVMRIINIFI